MTRFLLAMVAGAALLAGCSTGTTGQPPPARSIADAQQVATAPTPGYEISVPSIGMRSSLAPLGLNPDKTIQVPPVDRPGQAGYYAKGPKPGEPGPAVVLCHVNGNGQPGCGARFAELAAGDEVDVATPDGLVTYRVYRMQAVDKASFPTREVYSDTRGPELRLVTCGGALDASGRNYVQNVVAYAAKV